MKQNYENVYRFKLTRRTPVIIRLDGKAFHSLTRGCEKPFDDDFYESMYATMLALCQDIQGVRCAYMQSDEISLLLTDFDTIRTEAWFDYNLQKIVSISASIASTVFSLNWMDGEQLVLFDSRAFNIPQDEVKNYFIWRQLDWIRNSVQMLSQAHFSHKELHKKNQEAMHDMLHEKGINWADLEPKWKNGTFLFKDGRLWCPLKNLILTKDERPVIGNVFEHLVWRRYDGSLTNFGESIDVLKIEMERNEL